LVTGGSSGIGRATALAFASRGARVVVASRSRDRALSVVRALELAGGDGYFIPADVSIESAVEAMVAETMELYGRLDVAVNCAALTDPVLAPTAELDEAEFDQMIAVTLKGVWLCMKHELKAMVAGKGGAIVNLASANGLHGTPGASHYAAAKHGVLGLTKTAALEYAERGIRINALCPGPTDTPLLRRMIAVREEDAGEDDMAETLARRTPMKRLAQPEEVASAILWLCSPDASYVTGTFLRVDGGLAAGIL
jgi:NAD(P)-dependent dehydrogenase (short-subunit alcohol dehydrogenase family)